MNVGWIQKYALNLGWFLLLLGGISLLDRGTWFYVGLLMVLVGLLNMMNTLRLLYLGKTAFLLSIGSMYWLNIGALIVLSFAHVLTTKKGISWELVGFLVVSALFLFAAKPGAQDEKVQPPGKRSARG
jgi:lysylphosphatidylglycerol synthetase-like protein (DUF2156 family)